MLQLSGLVNRSRKLKQSQHHCSKKDRFWFDDLNRSLGLSVNVGLRLKGTGLASESSSPQGQPGALSISSSNGLPYSAPPSESVLPREPLGAEIDVGLRKTGVRESISYC
jgi:hypothetical protein